MMVTMINGKNIQVLTLLALSTALLQTLTLTTLLLGTPLAVRSSQANRHNQEYTSMVERR